MLGLPKEKIHTFLETVTDVPHFCHQNSIVKIPKVHKAQIGSKFYFSKGVQCKRVVFFGMIYYIIIKMQI